MVNFFLKAKHWQLFLVLFGIPLLIYLILIVVAFWSIASTIEYGIPSMDSITVFFQIIPFLIILPTFFLLAWYWSIGVGLQVKLPAEIKLKTGVFKGFIILIGVYLLLFAVTMTLLISNLAVVIAGLFPIALLLPLLIFHLFVVGCIFYCMYFVAKTLKTVEYQRRVSIGDYGGEIFLVWFFPIGVWLLQPIVNKVATQDFEGDEFVNEYLS